MKSFFSIRLVKKVFTCLLLEDFNYLDIDFDSYTTEEGPSDLQYEFIETIRDCYLYQHILHSTRGRGYNSPSCIDLVFTNEKRMISDVCID